MYFKNKKKKSNVKFLINESIYKYKSLFMWQKNLT